MRVLALAIVMACGPVSPEPVQGPRAIRTSEHVKDARKRDEIARTRSTWPATEKSAAPMTPFLTTWEPDADEEAAACGRTVVEKPSGSPLTRHRVGGWNTEDGVVVLLGAVAGPAHRLLADLRCYRAWLMAGKGVEKDAPLALPGLVVELRGDQDGITMTLTPTDTALVPELQRRTRRQIEQLRTPPRHED